MTRQHGTKACYVFGPDRGGDRSKGCRCEPCRAGNRASENTRNRLIAYGQWNPYADAEPARQHAKALMASGMGWKRIAELSGLSSGAISRLLYGGPGTRPPTRRIRPETEAAILALRPVLDVLSDGATVDGTGTRRRIQALVARGWSQAKIAAQLGMQPGNFGHLIYRRPRVTAATARAVRDLYAELWDRNPPEETHRDKIAASRARRYAAERRWPPPLAWDDIDSPQAVPAEGWQRPPQLSAAEIAAEARDLERLGLTRGEAAGRIGVSSRTLHRALRSDRDEEAGEAA